MAEEAVEPGRDGAAAPGADTAPGTIQAMETSTAESPPDDADSPPDDPDSPRTVPDPAVAIAGSVASMSPVPPGRAVRYVGRAFIVLAALMLPWTVFLALQLPSSHPSAHYDLAWGGFDVAMMVALAATAWAALRLHPALPSLAAVTGTLLLVDAWFDVVTSPDPDERWIALAMAVLVEVPLAGVCLWLSVTGHQLVIRRLQRRWWRRSRSRPGLRTGG